MEWISIEEKLPEHESNVIIWTVDKNMWFDVMFTDYPFDDAPAFYDEATDNIIKLKEVTHWMPLPEPPK